MIGLYWLLGVMFELCWVLMSSWWVASVVVWRFITIVMWSWNWEHLSEIGTEKEACQVTEVHEEIRAFEEAEVLEETQTLEETAVVPLINEATSRNFLGISINSLMDFSNKSLQDIHRWYPVFCEGVCRIIGCFAESNKQPEAIFSVTGVIICCDEVQGTHGIVHTLWNRYRLVGPPDVNAIAIYTRTPVPEVVPSLTGNNWLRDTVTFSAGLNVHPIKSKRWVC